VRTSESFAEDESSGAAFGSGGAFCRRFYYHDHQQCYGAPQLLYLGNVLHRNAADCLLGSLQAGALS